MIPSNLTPNTVNVVAEYFGLQEMEEKLQGDQKIETKSNTLFATYCKKNKSNGVRTVLDVNVNIEGLESLDKKLQEEINRQLGKFCKIDVGETICDVSPGQVVLILADVGGFCVKGQSFSKEAHGTHYFTLQN